MEWTMKAMENHQGFMAISPASTISSETALIITQAFVISDDLRPNPLVVNVLKKLCRIIPTWKIIPTQDIIDVAFRDLEVRKEIRSNPYCYKGRPRLQTGNQLMTVSLHLEQRLQEVSLPFLIVHGGDDKVTDPAASKLLFESARSEDKIFKLYPGMWHALTYGELPENTDIVFADIVLWLNDRVSMRMISRLESEQKFENDGLLKGGSSKDSL
ncbi:alpha/beta-Hydrolases superfamily protein [Actinidia rufa]|uniref:Alpha/beta-Hydrolases superfamily protein n=1 Tax=Actinidia rufa TaxID=165716 RepID=A0A7J0E6U8_9ERIC|nr:alpha/beta-Hydrolases superfamily protein [Actinidia rufa]